MSIYEDPRYVDQLADEAVAEDLERQELITLTNYIIAEIKDPKTRLALESIMILLKR